MGLEDGFGQNSCSEGAYGTKNLAALNVEQGCEWSFVATAGTWVSGTPSDPSSTAGGPKLAAVLAALGLGQSLALAVLMPSCTVQAGAIPSQGAECLRIGTTLGAAWTPVTWLCWSPGLGDSLVGLGTAAGNSFSR